MTSKKVVRSTRELILSENTKDDAVYVWNRTDATFYARLLKKPAGFLEVEIRTQP